MPIYKCYSPKGLLTDSNRQQIAKEVTTIHCEATGAPPSFVNVMFLEIPASASFVAGQPSTRSLIEETSARAVTSRRDRDVTRVVADVDTAHRPIRGRPHYRAGRNPVRKRYGGRIDLPLATP